MQGKSAVAGKAAVLQHLHEKPEASAARSSGPLAPVGPQPIVRKPPTHRRLVRLNDGLKLEGGAAPHGELPRLDQCRWLATSTRVGSAGKGPAHGTQRRGVRAAGMHTAAAAHAALLTCVPVRQRRPSGVHVATLMLLRVCGGCGCIVK